MQIGQGANQVSPSTQAANVDWAPDLVNLQTTYMSLIWQTYHQALQYDQLD